MQRKKPTRSESVADRGSHTASYNSGRHISTNGHEFAGLMDELVRAWPVPLESIDLLAHSMGSLVVRSALHPAAEDGQDWPSLVGKVVFLGAPHHGAPLERSGQRLSMLLSMSPYTEPFTRLGELRSAGITDLRFGNLLDSDWKGQDRFAFRADARTPVPLPTGIQCYAIGAVAGATVESLQGQLIGDGLVPLDSALGRHRDPRYALSFPVEHQWVALRTNHLQLQTSHKVYQRVKAWLSERYPAARGPRAAALRSGTSTSAVHGSCVPPRAAPGSAVHRPRSARVWQRHPGPPRRRRPAA